MNEFDRLIKSLDKINQSINDVKSSVFWGIVWSAIILGSIAINLK